MGLTVGPATWHPDYQRYLVGVVPLGTAICGGYIYCRNGLGTAFIISPASTEVCVAWNGNTNLLDGDKCCVSVWNASLSTALTNAGLTPSQWFVPSDTQFVAAYACRSFWGPSPCFASGYYWTSTEFNSTNACIIGLFNGTLSATLKFNETCTRAFRCVNY
jgi:hypothetical protein